MKKLSNIAVFAAIIFLGLTIYAFISDRYWAMMAMGGLCVISSFFGYFGDDLDIGGKK
jgi:hypothetical protein